MKIFIVALLCIGSALADVSEIVHQHQLGHESAILVEQPSVLPYGLPNNEGVEIVEAIEVLPVPVDVGDGDITSTRIQLTESHPDYQGPYHYERPEITLEYGTPSVAPPQKEEKEEEVLPEEVPNLKDQPAPVPSTYLPPYLQPVPLLGDNLVKRHVKYVVRRRV